ncbi:MAG TPA: TIM-barrel domain-containing protein [Vicinamibacterales bacterium]|nr:TIM-barrel domain-containing protein [Vicinamibacterales bacterium]
MPNRRDALKGLGTFGATLLLRLDTGAQGEDLVVAGQPVELRVASVSPHTVRVSVVPRRPAAPGAAASGLNPDGGLGTFSEQRRAVPRSGSIKAGNLTVTVTRAPLGVRIADASAAIQDLTVTDAGVLQFAIGGAPLLGFGEGGPQFDRRGAVDAMRNGQGGYRLRTHGGRVPIQWLIGTGGWGLFIHQPLGAFDLTGPRGTLTSQSPLPIDCFVVASKDPAIVMREYARITGLPAMPPRWSFGYQQSHRTLAGPGEVMWVAKTMREKKLPCDALIYLGTDFTPSGWNTHNGEFTWKTETFPDPKTAIDELHALNYKVVLHVVIEGRRLHGTVKDVCAAPEPSGRTPEGQWPPDRSVGCYWPHHKGVFDLGVDGWWPDQGDGLDAPSRLNRIRMYWEGSQLWRPDQRPYALHRNGYAGMARFGAFLWSGDVYSTWETLKTHVPVAVNTGLSGIPYWGTDIGGFVPTAEFTGELYVRWFQFGAFCPLFRSHGRAWHLRLPWGWNLGETGPGEITTYSGAALPPPSELHNGQVEPICRKYLELRYRLMPYLYSAVRETAQTGMPILRAMWLHHPDDPAAVSRGDQYFWGRDLLVAPVVEKGAASRRVYLPRASARSAGSDAAERRGSWFDFWTEERVEGGREIERAVDLATMPIYVRAGAIVPTGPVKQYTAQPDPGPLSITVYPGADGAFDLFEDDGTSFEYRRGAWMGISMRWDDRAGQLSLSLTPGSRMRAPLVREVEVRVAGQTRIHRAAFSGRRAIVP